MVLMIEMMMIMMVMMLAMMMVHDDGYDDDGPALDIFHLLTELANLASEIL